MKLSPKKLQMLRSMIAGRLRLVDWTRGEQYMSANAVRCYAGGLVDAGYAERVGTHYQLTDAGRELVRQHTPTPSRSYVNASQRQPLQSQGWTPPRGETAQIGSRGWA